MTPGQSRFALATVMVLGLPWIAPLFAWIGAKPFSAADWTLFAVMFMFALAASTKSALLGVLKMISGAVGAAIYARQPDGTGLPLTQFWLVFGPLLVFMLAQALERYKMHWERDEEFW